MKVEFYRTSGDLHICKEMADRYVTSVEELVEDMCVSCKDTDIEVSPEDLRIIAGDLFEYKAYVIVSYRGKKRLEHTVDEKDLKRYNLGLPVLLISSGC